MDLLFVYNANGGTLNALLDAGHKLFSPKTYACSLCQLTYGALAERKAWRDFRKSTTLDLTFLHKDEFEEQYQSAQSYPVVLSGKDRHEVFVSTKELNSLQTLDQLITLISVRAREGAA